MPEPTTAVIGAGGFVGRALSEVLIAQDPQRVRMYNRTPGEVQGRAFERLPRQAGDLSGVDIVVHLAGKAHQLGVGNSYVAPNVDLPMEMARLARDAGATRFVFVSSLATYGRYNENALTPQTDFAPTTPYGESKVMAEGRLEQLLKDGPLQLAIVRPPMIYGRDAKANFRALARAARMGAPLPTGLARARRSMVSLTNLTDAIIHLCNHERAGDAPLVLLPADDRDLMVREVYEALAGAAGKKVWQIPVPLTAMHAALKLAGREETFDSLFRPAVIDRSHWSQTGWTPPQSVEAGLQEAMTQMS